MIVNPFICLSDSHEMFDQDSLIMPSFAPVTNSSFEKESDILSLILPKTTNTIIIKNLKYKSHNTNISSLLQPFGEIFSIKEFNSKGFAIVTFYDSRCAERFVKEVDRTVFNNKKIRCDMMFTYNNKSEKESLEKCPNIIMKPVNVKNSNDDPIIKKEEIINYVSENFGELRQIINCDNDIYILEFYDFRNAQKMIQKNGNIQISEKQFQVSYALDIINNINQIRNEQNILYKHDISLHNLYF